MAQAAVLDGERFDLLPPFDDGLVAPEVDVGRGEIAEALVVPAIVVVMHEGLELLLEITRQEVVFQQDAVFQGLVLALYLALGLGMVGGTTHMPHRVIPQPVCQIAGDVGRAVTLRYVACERPWHCRSPMP